jgi:hypothetical protein
VLDKCFWSGFRALYVPTFPDVLPQTEPLLQPSWKHQSQFAAARWIVPAGRATTGSLGNGVAVRVTTRAVNAGGPATERWIAPAGRKTAGGRVDGSAVGVFRPAVNAGGTATWRRGDATDFDIAMSSEQKMTP